MNKHNSHYERKTQKSYNPTLKFIRINKSALANEAHLERFTASFNGAVDAVFRSGYREYVSRRCFAEIKRRYDHV